MLNPLTIDLQDEAELSIDQRRWLKGAICCLMKGWDGADRKRYEDKVSNIRRYIGCSAWYAECRAFQVIANRQVRSGQGSRYATALATAAGW